MRDVAHAAAAERTGDFPNGLRRLFRSVEGEFVREEPREHAFAYVCGLLSRSPTWHSGGIDGRNRLLTTARWDEDRVRDRIRDIVTRHGGATGSTLVVAEEGFLKKGRESAGVERQFCAASGRAGNYQIGIFLLCFDSRGTVAAIDRELFLPPSWLDCGTRRKRGGIPADLAPATRDQLGERMLARALAALTPERVVAPATPRVTALLRGHGIAHTPTTPASARRAARHFRTARDRAGLDRYSARRWRAWYRHITLSMLAHTFLTTAPG
ncbi:transposase [Streptomyces radicis]|uniref:Transposase IS701-like DDE domain-containing protein n=1 Tax=Streptomyces radicis TaxID=1750517 RepID=A0A3A9WFJ3_9ACTN|nr:transposase [Streptomyces radicis]RKN11559.1 hypothetical protein D7319_06425 [Streptomyces radicis]RKN26423.1 hypothetical protein D7318_03235 [Streptomyces radicis]